MSATQHSVIDRSSRRWTVAVHEAAHAVVGTRLGWKVAYCVIHAGSESGETFDVPPRGLDPRRRSIEDAVIGLAGTCASARQRLVMPYGCQHDQNHARRVLAGTGIGFGEAKGQARLLVARHWIEINRVARRLYRRGSLQTLSGNGSA